ncbi:MAG: AAA family ATPase [Deltaproteobacteria bacterium]|nr:AAA family ATPase [Deltaproteobacteria bacterium]
MLPPHFLFPPFRLDALNEQLWHGTEEISLRRKTFAVLRYLVEHPGHLVTKEHLLEAVWPGTYVSESLPTTCIRELRKALGDEAKTPRFIQTVHGRGYRFIAPLTASQLPPSQKSKVESRKSSLAPNTQHLAPPLVGRETQLAQLHSWWAKALNGERQIIFVTGEPGIGKTTVVEAFLSGIGQQGTGNGEQTTKAKQQATGNRQWRNTDPTQLIPNARSPMLDPQRLIPSPWLGRGQCIEHYGVGEAYMPVLEALGRLCKEPSGERIISLLHRHAPTWLAQMPTLLTTLEREQLQREVHGVTRERMLREMAEALEALTAEHPLILWLEDLHWSDVSTLELLSVLARRSEPARLLVIGSYRPVEMLANGHPLRAVKQELHVHGLCEELQLGLLTEDQVAEYLAMRMALPSPGQGEGSLSASFPELTRMIHRRTEGNPLFMVNIMDYLIAEEKFTEAIETRQVAALPSLSEMLRVVPTGLRPMIERQLDRLSVKEQQVLEVASVAGAQFSTAAVAEGLKQMMSEVETCCARLARGEQFIRATGMSAWPDGTVATNYSFLHALYQEVLYERIPAGQRVTLHKQIGEREEHAYGDQAREIAAELAVHFERGRDYLRAVQYLRLAGENANRRSAHQEAIALLTKGLELLKRLPDSPERIWQELTLQILFGPALVAMKGYAAPEVEQTYTRARKLCQLVGESPQLFRVLRGLWVLYLVQAKLRTAQELGEQLFNLAQSAQNPALLLEAHRPLGTTLFHRGKLSTARAHLELGIALYDPEQHRSHAFLYGQEPGVVSCIYASHTLWFLGYPDQALQKIHEALTLAEEAAHPFSQAWALFFAAVAHQLRREGQAAQEQTEEVIALCTEQAFPYWLAKGTILHGWALTEQGRKEEGITQMRGGLDAHRATGSELWRPYYFALLAEQYGKMQQSEEGLKVLTEALVMVERTGERFYEAELYRIKGALTLAQSKTSLGQVSGKSQTSQEKSEDPNTQHLTPSTQAEAETCFLKAVAIAQKQQAKSLELRATVSLTQLWQSQGKTAEAQQRLVEIYHWFTEGFDTKDLQEARALLNELQR